MEIIRKNRESKQREANTPMRVIRSGDRNWQALNPARTYCTSTGSTSSYESLTHRCVVNLGNDFFLKSIEKIPWKAKRNPQGFDVHIRIIL